ncbi:OB-fold domain-containing protein [Patescibacteria group bacterium]|nr:OB-fold domain-containing protein [Patescibacteria group bacterium]MBU0776922.1 OB-fold domain-containing protein [Patescibacteria group bacterium]MBU0845962.1 OB-fold domain-containing protein [Patescibacteria group bacterium]MBU0922501.1 OB-fold domain-containing protein [Patescibacteria group bacterium]MBU1066321.1 OB-fold domain-containing protein [Patescibacteria group bacterium]
MSPEKYQFGGRGEVYSYTVLYEAPPGYEEQAPYVLALIQLKEGPMVTAQLTDLEYEWIDGIQEYKVEIGMSVEMVTRRLKSEGDKGILVYGYKFRPPLEISGDNSSI